MDRRHLAWAHIWPGGKKRNFYHDDIWTLKYLPKFKWHHLTESVGAFY